MDKIRNYLTFKRVSSILLIILLVIGMININYRRTNASVNKPEITVTGPEVNPQEPMEGQEVEVKYKLTPQPFQYNIPKSKEIVLVLDKSGSMGNNKKMENLKTAALNFIDSLTQIDTKTNKPKVAGLKVGIVSYDESGNVNSDLIELSTSDAINTTNKDKLKKIIKDLEASGGTNTGDGLRKGVYLLNKGSENANKTIIFMGDGEPTYYSYYESNGNYYYYTVLDKENPKEENRYNSEPYLGGSGSGDDIYENSLRYAEKIGEIIKNKSYNVFSIGYGLGNSNSDGNKKMKRIHTSMGGVIGGDKNSFFATDSGAIDSVFGQIADTLTKSYTFSDVMLDVKLNNPIEAVDGIEVNGVKVEPIVYELKDNYWYTANEVEVVFKVKANKYGKILLFDNNYNNKLKYKGIDGNMIEVPLNNPEINIKPYNLDEGKKLNILAPQQINALIGDTINYDVNIKHPGVKSMNYTDGKYNISEGFPDILEINSGNLNNTFGSIGQGESKVIENKFTVKNNENIGIDNAKSYDITGKYEYIANDGSIYKSVSGSLKTQLNIKRSQLKVNVVDKNDKPITGDFSVNIKGGVIDKTSSKVENGYLVFDTLPTFDYEVILKSVPNGYEIPESNNAIVKVNYDNNNPIYTFKLQGDGEETETINILEIQPADSFKISTKNMPVKSGIEESVVYINESKLNVQIEHITMAEYIGKIDKINGKYDVVVIGRYIENNKTIVNYDNYYTFNDYNKTDNDITDRKSNEITDFIKSGQIVYIDNNIKSNPNIIETKVSKHFTNDWNKGYSNVKKYTTEVKVENILEEYIKVENKYKRPKIKIISSDGDTQFTEGNKNQLGSIVKRNMIFNITRIDSLNEKVKINLYLDINGDGLFKEEEIVKSIQDVNLNKDGYTVEYNLYDNFPDFIGMLDWKIEVEKMPSNEFAKSIVSYDTGRLLFRRLAEEKRIIRVLQVSSYNRTEIGDNINKNLNLAENVNFSNLLKMPELSDYEITREVISYQDFYQNGYKGPGRDPLNGKYDMVIMGFADSYGDKLSIEALNQIEAFIKTGQGLMLTHDTLFYVGNNFSTSPIIKRFADWIGQSRYISSNNPTENDINGQKIPHDPDKPSGSESVQVGGTSFRRRELQPDKVNGINESNSTKIYKTNEALITQYPFKLEGEMPVRRTHAQYLQLNLEDENVVPWFNLTEDNSKGAGANNSSNHTKNYVNRYDTRNAYYTYSKGNITFSGTGENTRQSVQYPDPEMRLFINTIVKAERGANHAPTIEALSETTITEVPVGKDFNFDAIIRDIDGDKVRINSVKLDNSLIMQQSNFNNSGYKASIKINSEKLNISNKELTLIIEAEDIKGAKTQKSYKIRPVNEGLITAENKEINCLKGDLTAFKIELIKNNDNIRNPIRDITVSLKSQYQFADITDLRVSNDGSFIEGTLKSNAITTSGKISLVIGYTNNIGSKEANVEIFVNSKEGIVNLVATGINGSDISDKINSVDLGNKIAPVYDSNLKQYSFKSITSGNYNLKVNYDYNKYYLQDKNTGNIVPTNGEQVSLSYDNNVVTKEYTLISVATNIKHGLYNSVSNNNLNVTEGSVQLVRGSTANIAIGLTVMSNNTAVSFEIDESIKNREAVGLYKIEGNNIESITGQDVFKVNGNKYEVKLPSNITSETKLVILYKCRVPEINESNKTEFINKVFINGTEIENKKFSIRATTNENKEILLPDLF